MAERIFQFFQRLNRAEDYAGTGMDLALVHKAMQRMGGTSGPKARRLRAQRFIWKFQVSGLPKLGGQHDKHH